MIEVFKTNVINGNHARRLIDRIHCRFAHYRANFDLHDCDNILRVESMKGEIDCSLLIGLLQNEGFHAEILSDD